MQPMKSRRLLIRPRKRQQFRLSIQFSQKRQARRRARPARIHEISRIVRFRLRRILASKSVRQNQRGMPRQVRANQLRTIRRRHNHVDVFKYFCRRFHQHRSRSRRLNVFHRRNEPRRSKRIRPVVILLRRQQFVPARSRQIVKCRRGLRNQHRRHRVVRKFRQLHRNRLHSHFAQFLERRIQVFFVVLLPRLRRFAPLFLLLALLLFFRCFRRLFFRRLRPLFRRRFERRLYITHAHSPHVQIRIPIERRRLHRLVLAVLPINRVEHQRAIFHRSANRPQLVHAPRKRHRARSWHQPKRRPQSRAAASRRRRRNRSQRLRPNAERHASRRRRRSRSRRRSARSLFRVPRIPRNPSEPHIALRQRAQRQ